ncbi:MAG TPA: histidine kinase [Terriglobales bacterium]|nr:histidine kinase [Terriglobales bacterium]
MTDHAHSVPLQRRLWAAAVGFWMFVAAMSVAQTMWLARTPGQHVNLGSAVEWQVVYFGTWIPITIAVWNLTRHWLPERFGGWLRVLLAHLPVLTAVILVQPFIVTLFNRAIRTPQASIWTNLGRSVREQLTALSLIYVAIAVTGAAMTLYERYQDRQVMAARLQAELATAKLQSLRGHLQPHFLFNSLHSVAALARAGDTAGVVRLVAALSDLLRHVLDVGDRHTSLREELHIVERYLEIQRTRFADRLEVTIDLAPNVADARVPLLLVQPLVENALRHGLAPQARAGSVSIRAVRTNGTTRIEVEDTGIGLPPEWKLPDATGTGLRNLVSRLTTEFGAAASLEVVPREGGGVRATVTLPYMRP